MSGSRGRADEFGEVAIAGINGARGSGIQDTYPALSASANFDTNQLDLTVASGLLNLVPMQHRPALPEHAKDP